jgi:hypothetical protein
MVVRSSMLTVGCNSAERLVAVVTFVWNLLLLTDTLVLVFSNRVRSCE